MLSLLSPPVLSLVASADLFDSGREWTPDPSFEAGERQSARLARILIVDDEPSVRRMLRRLLSEGGYQIVEAGDGAEALEIAIRDESGFDLVITDIKMPVMDGRELGRLLHATMPELPVLYTSGYTSDTGSKATQGGKSLPFLRKPFEPDGLLRSVASMLRQRDS